MDWSKNALRGGKGVLGSGSQRFKQKAGDLDGVGPGQVSSHFLFYI
jgi:hypothetical protein